jgi:hypothetical protein
MKRLTSLAKLSLGLSLIIGMIGCGKLDTPISTGGSAGVGITTTTIPVVFSVDVGTSWESGTSTNSTVSPWGTCSISTTDSTKTCPTISIPEGQLYYSKLIINASVTNKAECAVFAFAPYYYQMSNQANFFPSFPLFAYSAFTALDCSAIPTPVGCFAGPATKIVPSFPTNTWVYYLPSTDPVLNWSIDSANKVRQEQNLDPGNRWTTNDLLTKTSSYYDVQGNMVYVSNSMQDYSFQCRDTFGDIKHSMTLTLAVDKGVTYQNSNWQTQLLVPTTTTTIPTATTTSTTTTSPVVTTTTLPVFEVNFSTSWQTDPSNVLTDVNGGPCTFSTTDSSPKSCTGLSVPEAELYSGKLTINAKINDTTNCKIFKFMPYYYRMSGQDNFVPSTADADFTPLQCQTSPKAGCYSGPATQLIPSFPSSLSPLRYFTSVNSNLTWTINSAETVRSSLKYDPGNRWTTNDLSDQTVSQVDYVANSMRPYRFECDDASGKPQYVMNVQLSVESGGPGEYSNWQSALTTTTLSSTTTTTNPNIFQVNVGTIWETDTTNTVIPQGSCSYSVTDGSSKTCNLSIPEAELYYGKLKLDAAVTNQSRCGIFLFRPYYYMMGNSATFVPSNASSSFSAIDCSGATSTPPAGCYAGAAVSIVPNFPAFRGIYNVTSVSPTMSWTASSAVSVAGSAYYDPGNRWTTNDLVGRGTAQTDYVANSMQDYVFSCRDVNDDPIYSLTLKLSVIPGSGGYDESHW